MPKVSDVPQRILGYISDYDRQHGFSPTIREICAGIGICSASTVHRHIIRLKEQGILIETKPGSPRSLAINCTVNVDGDGNQAKHLCLQTADGGTLILDCKAVDGRLEFNGPINAAGLHSAKAKRKTMSLPPLLTMFPAPMRIILPLAFKGNTGK